VSPIVVQDPSQTYITPLGAAKRVPVLGDDGNENAIIIVLLLLMH
jgi:hypothetical protein